jgi:hypothetical protein
MTTQDAAPSRRRRGRRILWLCVLVAIGFPVGLWVKARIGWSLRLEQRLKAVRDAGLPTTPAELNRWYRLPEGVAENAADTYLEAFACYVEPNDADTDEVPLIHWGDPLSRTAPFSDRSRGAIDRFLAANKQALDLLHEAATIPACRYPADFRLGMAIRTPWYIGIRHATSLLACEAITHADRGQPDLAIRSLESALDLGNSLAAEPMLVSQLLRVGSQSMVFSTLERLLTGTQLTQEQLLAIDHDVARIDDPNGLRTGLVGERVFGLGCMELSARDLSIAVNGDCSVPSQAFMGAYDGLGLVRRDQAEHLDFMAAMFAVLGLPEPKRLDEARAIGRQIEQIPQSHVLTRMFVPGMGGCAETGLRHSAQRRAVRTALAIERYRLKSGSLPVSLDVLVPDYLAAVPPDPFTGQPLKYRQSAKGYVVYSVGQDLSDDGGKEKPAKGEGPYDVTFVVER